MTVREDGDGRGFTSILTFSDRVNLYLRYMLKNYLKIAFRHLIKNKTYTAINALGLAFGISACLYIYLITSFEFSYDKFHPGKERIFRVVSDEYTPKFGQEHNSNIADPYPGLMRSNLTGIESMAVFYNTAAKVTVYGNNGLPVNKQHLLMGEETLDLIIADQSYFDIFKYQWLTGNASTALEEPFKVVLTESKAYKYFGKVPFDQMIGKTIVYNDSLSVTVAGIVKDLPGNSDLRFTDFISFSTVQHSFLKTEFDANPNRQVYVKLTNGTRISDVNAQLSAFVKDMVKVEKGVKIQYHLQPLADIHFNSDYSDSYSHQAHLPTIYALIGIALFILVIAVINFVNLSTALSTTRLKEIGIRKVCGSSRISLVLQSLGETFLLTLFASILSVICLGLLVVGFPSLMPDTVQSTLFSLPTFLFLLLVAIFTAVLAGFYPAQILSSYLPVRNLRGVGQQQRRSGGGLRRSLIIFQFTVSLVFIIGAFMVGNQVHFMLNKDLGFSKDAVITIGTYPDYPAGKKNILAQKIRQLSQVDMVSVSEGTPLAKGHFHNPLIYKGGKQVAQADCQLEWADENFIPLYQIKILAGRNLAASDSAREILINATCAKALGFATPEAAIGKSAETILSPEEGFKPFRIVGVVADFHVESLQKAITPAFITSSNEWTRLVSVRLATKGKGVAEFKNTIAELEHLWNGVYPNDKFEYSFFDESIRRLYDREERFSLLMNISMILALFISCIGLFGLAAFTAQQRGKEIAIRKVLGASVRNIVLILCRETMALILIAIAIASPIAWLLVQKWLANFSYRIDLSVWIIVAAGFMAVVIAMATISIQVIKAAVVSPIKSIKAE